MRLLTASLLLATVLTAHAGPPAIYDEGADAKADGDDEEVLRQGEGADNAVEREAGVQHFQIDEGAETAAGRFAHRPLRGQCRGR